jgi:hypothetical protein
MNIRRWTQVGMCVLVLGGVGALGSRSCAAEASRPAQEPGLAQIASVTSRMAAAVLAGDSEAYLAQVWKGDEVFWVEQRNWAADLRVHVPTSYAIELDESGLVVHRDGSMTVPMTTVWAMGEAEPSAVRFAARFVDSGDGFRYAGEHWTRVEAAGVVVLVDAEIMATGLHVAEVMPRVRSVVDAMLGVTIEGTPEVKVYRSMQHLQQSIYLSYVDPLSGWNEPGEAMKLLYNPRQTGAGLRTLLAHEYGHVATFAMGANATDMPWWVLEGVAEWCAAEFGRSGSAVDRRVRRWAEQDNLRDWGQLSDFRGEAMNHMAHVYSQGHHMIRFMESRAGRAKVLAWLRAMASGEEFGAATLDVLGEPFEVIDAQWRAQFAAENPQ